MRRIVVIVVLSVIVAGCLPSPSLWVGSGVRVGVVGDSIVYVTEHDTYKDANHHLTDALVAAGYAVSASDKIGATTTDLGTLPPWPTPGAEIVSIELGTNDMDATTTPGQPSVAYAIAEANYNAYLVSLDAAGVRCVVLVEVALAPSWGLDVTGPVWNTYLASVAATRPAGSTVIVPWAAQAIAHPEYVAGDGVHPTDAGKTALINDEIQAIGACQ